MKLGPTVDADEVVALCKRLNPDAQPGRLMLISRMGADHVGRAPARRSSRRCRDTGQPVVWACDPMHGNTFSHSSGLKTRQFDDVMRELRGFFGVCHAAGVWPGGVHVELTGEDVTECLGGTEAVLDADLESALRDDVRPAAQRPPVARPRVPDRRAPPRHDHDPAPPGRR